MSHLRYCCHVHPTIEKVIFAVVQQKQHITRIDSMSSLSAFRCIYSINQTIYDGARQAHQGILSPDTHKMVWAGKPAINPCTSTPPRPSLSCGLSKQRLSVLLARTRCNSENNVQNALAVSDVLPPALAVQHPKGVFYLVHGGMHELALSAPTKRL